MMYSALPLARNRSFSSGAECARPRVARHEMCAEGIRITLPAGGLLSDGDAKRLAWGILNDLAPDETIPVPEVVTYKEAQRLAVMRVLAEKPRTIDECASALAWGRRVTERRLHELLQAERIERFKADDYSVLFRLPVVP